jgi:hypothetical protein
MLGWAFVIDDRSGCFDMRRNFSLTWYLNPRPRLASTSLRAVEVINLWDKSDGVVPKQIICHSEWWWIGLPCCLSSCEWISAKQRSANYPLTISKRQMTVIDEHSIVIHFVAVSLLRCANYPFWVLALYAWAISVFEWPFSLCCCQWISQIPKYHYPLVGSCQSIPKISQCRSG